MKRIFYLMIFSCIINSCRQEKSTEIKTIDKTVEKKVDAKPIDKKANGQEQKIEQSITAEDTLQTHIFKKGETLWDLCRKYYGNRHYSSIISIYNNIENVNNIDDGAIIKIPSIKILLNDSELGLVPIIKKEIEKILEARALFMKHEEILSDLRKNVKDRTPIELPKSVKEDLRTAIKYIDESIISLNDLNSDSIKAPTKVIGQLKRLSANLNNLSQGNHDGVYKYDLDMVHQRLVHVIKNSITWVQNDYR